MKRIVPSAPRGQALDPPVFLGEGVICRPSDNPGAAERMALAPESSPRRLKGDLGTTGLSEPKSTDGNRTPFRALRNGDR